MFSALTERNKELIPFIARLVLHKIKLTRKASGLKPSLLETFHYFRSSRQGSKAKKNINIPVFHKLAFGFASRFVVMFGVFFVCVFTELGKDRHMKKTSNKRSQSAVSIKFCRKPETTRDVSYFYSSATYFNYQTTLYHVITISLMQISSVCGKADMGETKAFCLHNTLSHHHTLETPISIVVLVRNNKNSVRPAKLRFCSRSHLLLYAVKAAWQGKAIVGQVLLLVEAALQLGKSTLLGL